MGLFSFLKKAGAKVFKGRKAEEEQHLETDAEKDVHAQELFDFVKAMGFDVTGLKVRVEGDKVTLGGEVPSQTEKEKIILAVGNVEGVGSVEDTLSVVVPAPEAQFYTVQSGDSLSKIAKEFYGNANAYNQIFEANKPMLKDVDHIYPGQVLRIPQA
ncbi:MAG: peptidoglycan-binding protein LysM [Chitinophagales bacterium]|nr:peptidoglycan-binding protein LysM [Chitinophagales bacterium]